MNTKILITSIVFSLALVAKITPPARALGCVNADVSNQVKVTGSQTSPGAQQNTVNQAIDPNSCVGNANVHNSNQIYVGPDGANQIRNSNQFSGGSGQNGVIPGNVMDAGNVNVGVSTSTSVYSPGLDPKFLPKK